MWAIYFRNKLVITRARKDSLSQCKAVGCVPSNEMLPVTVAVKFEKKSVFLVLHLEAASEQALICYRSALFFPSFVLQFASIFVFSLFNVI